MVISQQRKGQEDGRTLVVSDPLSPDGYPEGGANKENADILNSRIRDIFYDLRRQVEAKSK